MILTIALSGWLIALLLALRSARAYRSLPRLSVTEPAQNLPALSIIIPARNEAKNLPKLLGSLRQLQYPGPLEILVVDDQSSDSTAQVALAHGACVLSLGELTPGWLGKLLQQGSYRVALLRGESLVGVQMYQSSRQLWNGLTRLGSGALGETGPAAELTILYTTLIASPLVLSPLLLSPLWLVLWASAAILFIPWARRFGPTRLCLLAPAAATLIIDSGVWGIVQRLTKRGNLWKGQRV